MEHPRQHNDSHVLAANVVARGRCKVHVVLLDCLGSIVSKLALVMLSLFFHWPTANVVADVVGTMQPQDLLSVECFSA